MGRLEGISIPILRPLMTDFSMALDTAAQVIASTWVAKTTMVCEATRPKNEWFYTQGERARLMSSLSIPPNTLVWAGRNANSGSLYAHTRRMSNPVPVAGNRFEKGYVSTIGLGRLVFQLFSVRSDDDHDVTRFTFEARPGPWRESLFRIWPTTHSRVVWPPQGSFSDMGTTLDDLTKRFSRPD